MLNRAVNISISLVLLLLAINMANDLIAKASDDKNLNSTYEPLNRLVEDFDEGLDLEKGIEQLVQKNPVSTLDLPEIQYSYFKEMHNLASEVKNYTVEIKEKINWHLTYNSILWIIFSGSIGGLIYFNAAQNHTIQILAEQVALLMNYTNYQRTL